MHLVPKHLNSTRLKFLSIYKQNSTNKSQLIETTLTMAQLLALPNELLKLILVGRSEAHVYCHRMVLVLKTLFHS